MNKKPKPSTQTAIRLEDAMLERIDKHAKHMSEVSGVAVTRAGVHRLAVVRGMAALEAERKKQ